MPTAFTRALGARHAAPFMPATAPKVRRADRVLTQTCAGAVR